MSRWVSVGDQDGEIEHWTGEEWDQFRADARLGRMVRRMPEDTALEHHHSTWMFIKYFGGRAWHKQAPEQALQVGGVSDEDTLVQY